MAYVRANDVKKPLISDKAWERFSLDELLFKGLSLPSARQHPSYGDCLDVN